MIHLQAIWTRDRLHVWGLRVLQAREVNARASDDASPLSDWPGPFIRIDELRGRAGDVWDSLLVSGASERELLLRLPFVEGALLMPARDRGDTGAGDDAAVCGDAGGRFEFRTVAVPTLAFAVTDAVDFLTASAARLRTPLVAADSFRFWRRVALLVTELLARQRYVPAVDHLRDDSYRGYWRVMVEDEPTCGRLRALVESLPPVCRAVADGESPSEPARIVERFLWRAADALVRRCLEGDELAHALLDQPEEGVSAQMLWLRSLVSSEGMLGGQADQRRAVHSAVSGWLTKLEPMRPARSSVTCLTLHAPPTPDGATIAALDGTSWELTVHAQAVSDPSVVLNADVLLRPEIGDDPRILPRPFDNALEQVRADLTQAARYFPPLEPCVERNGPLACRLSLEDAYAFLRDAAPILESEGMVVQTPGWWRESRPRLRMTLDIRPQREEADFQPGQISLDALVEYDWRVAVGDGELTVEELTELASTKTPLVQLRGRWTEARPAEVQQALEFLSRHRRGRMTVLEALRQCYMAEDLETGLPVTGIRAHGWIDRFLGASRATQPIEFRPQPESFHGALRPYQLRGMAWLCFLSRLGLGACLADDMGLGKTIQLIALLLSERESGLSTGPNLLVVPTSLVGNWQRELARFAPSLRILVHHGLDRLSGEQFVSEAPGYDVVISTYSLAYRDLDHLSPVKWHRVTLDEAQNIKNPAAKQSIALHSLSAVHRVALTGTPVENRLSELWSILDFLNPGYLGSATEFRRRFAVPIERHRDTDRAGRLRDLIQPFVLRRLKSDPKVEVDLPEKMEMKVFCNLTKEQAALYEAIVTDMLAQIDRSDGIQRRGLILAALVKLKQVCNHPAQFLSESAAESHRSGKCDRLTEMLEEVLAEGDRALIFTQFRVMGNLLKPALEQALGCDVLFLHGGTPRLRRDAMVERFQDADGNAPLFLLSLKAGGFGLNLTAANHVFHFDRWWNPAVEDQATDRAHRLGQHRRVQVHKFVCVGTLEERIDQLLTQKRALADRVIGSGEDWLTELSTEQLRDMFALSKDAVADE